MSRLSIEAHPDVYSELEYSRSWYEERAHNLGTEFLDEIDHAVEAIYDAPDVWPLYDKGRSIHRFFLHRFPYAIVYRLTSSAIQIIAIAHMKRHPDYWKRRLTHW